MARSISISIRAAGLHLRNLAKQYNLQLQSKLEEGRPTTGGFTNVALTDLHLCIHALCSELASIRDYLATVIAIRVGAPARIEALNRLIEWAEKPINSNAQADPLAKLMFEANDAGSANPWLADITEYRNTFLHKLPLGAHDHGRRLFVEQRTIQGLTFHLLRLPILERVGSSKLIDALDRFTIIHNEMYKLASDAVAFAKYRPSVIEIVFSHA